MTKEELEHEWLFTCVVCGGKPRETRKVVNLRSGEQAKTIVYELLKMPKRFARNSKGESALVLDEEAVKSLLGVIG